MPHKKSNPNEWISLVNVVSCVAVIILHTNGCFWNFSKERYWVTADIIESLFYFAVPCFLMLSGATLLDFRERYSVKTYISKRVSKTVIPYLAWSVIGILFLLLGGSIVPSDITFTYLWEGIINSKIIPIYWYFPMLFGVYLTIPAIAAIDPQLKESVFKYSCLAGFITISVIPLVVYTFTDLTWNTTLSFQLSGYLLLVCGGWLICHCEISPAARRVIYLLALIGLLAQAVGTYVLSMRAGAVVTTFKGYINAPATLYSVGVIVWLKYHTEKLMGIRIINRIVRTLSPYTLSIYLMQYYIYNAILRIFHLQDTSAVYRVAAPLAVIIIAPAIVWVMRKVPVLRNIVPG